MADSLLSQLDTCRQLYNHTRYSYTVAPDDDKPSDVDQKNQLPALKKQWTDLKTVHSKVLQETVERFYRNLSNLSKTKQSGNRVGWLKWQRPREYRSMTFVQSGFELNHTSGHDEPSTLWLSKIGHVPITYHRPIPSGEIKRITVKHTPADEWYACVMIDEAAEPPEKPAVDEIPAEEMVGIDVGILSYTHDTTGLSVSSLDVSETQERLEREQRSLSRKQHGSNNYEKQRVKVAKMHSRLKRQRHDFLHKLSRYYVENYSFIAVEDLNVAGLMTQDRNSRNTAHASWRTFLDMLAYKAKRAGVHVVQVDPKDTTKACSACGVKTKKPLWVREHSCPSCGFTADRDWNASVNILNKALSQVGVGYSESTPVETALPVDTTSVSAKGVVEAGSPVLNARSA